jgi:hypothetical protein
VKTDKPNWPLRKRGETFGRWWLRLEPLGAAAFAYTARSMGILPQSLWLSYVNFDDTAKDTAKMNSNELSNSRGGA